jgi:hypothetical protein
MIALVSLFAAGNATAENSQPPKIQVVQLEKLEINEGLITDEIAKRFNTKVRKPTVTGEVSARDSIQVNDNQISREVSDVTSQI